LLRQSCWGAEAYPNAATDSLDEPRHRWFTGFGFGSRAAEIKCDAVLLQPKESIFARGLGSYMVRIGIIFAIVTIVMMEIVFISAMTLGLSLSPGRPWCLPPSVWRRWVTPSRSLRYSAHTGDEFFLQPLLLAAVTVTSAATGTNYMEPLRNFGTHWLSPLQLAICIGFSALIFVWIEGEKLFIRLVQAWRSR